MIVVLHQIFWTLISLLFFLFLFFLLDKNLFYIVDKRRIELIEKNNIFLNYCNLSDKLRIEINILSEERYKKQAEFLKNYELETRKNMEDQYLYDLKKFELNEIDYSDCYVSNDIVELIMERYI